MDFVRIKREIRERYKRFKYFDELRIKIHVINNKKGVIDDVCLLLPFLRGCGAKYIRLFLL